MAPHTVTADGIDLRFQELGIWHPFQDVLANSYSFIFLVDYLDIR